MEDFAGRVAVITGAGSGAGRAIALALAREGAHGVVVADIDEAATRETASLVRLAGPHALVAHADVADQGSMDDLAARAYREYGEVHLLFPNAGVAKPSPLVDAERADWDWVFAVNLHGVVNTVQAFVPRMLAQERDAHIVVTASMSGVLVRRNRNGVYTAVKHAVVAYCNVLRDELEPEGIAVSCWCPGGMATRIGDAARVRQEEYGGPLTATSNFGGDWEPPDAVMPRLLQGVRENRRYIFTHPETRPALERYYAEMFEDFDAGDRTAGEIG
ncbi:MAG: SDR family NAD(P)-dependent oxidoreductase [Chloroflexi bacterium]|nr:SDR family NAD(P)-dependent oxidoreductase [Chloroflexota bacterium]